VDAEAAKAAAELEAKLSMARLELRYADSILSKVPMETESAAFSLMERIITIRDQSEKARLSAIASNGDTATNNTITELTEHARKTITGVRAAMADMRKHDRAAAAELQALGKEIAAGMAQLAEIGEITERSRLIAFNMAIEAARIGSKGNGFKVIVNELRDLNDQTAVFSKHVSALLGRFREFTDSLIRKSSAGSSVVAEEVERGIQDEEKAIESLMTISNACIDMSGDIEQVVASVNKDLDGILESLQFQDITRQIVEGAQAILKEVRSELDGMLRHAENGGDIKPDQALTRELRSRLIASAHTRAEKEAIQEVII
jgi:methyl-accepting chemotaxis protein